MRTYETGARVRYSEKGPMMSFRGRAGTVKRRTQSGFYSVEFDGAGCETLTAEAFLSPADDPAALLETARERIAKACEERGMDLRARLYRKGSNDEQPELRAVLALLEELDAARGQLGPRFRYIVRSECFGRDDAARTCDTLEELRTALYSYPGGEGFFGDEDGEEPMSWDDIQAALADRNLGHAAVFYNSEGERTDVNRETLR